MFKTNISLKGPYGKMREEPTLTQEELNFLLEVLLEPESPRSVLDNDFFNVPCTEPSVDTSDG
jgi:hypothetical protein